MRCPLVAIPQSTHKNAYEFDGECNRVVERSLKQDIESSSVVAAIHVAQGIDEYESSEEAVRPDDQCGVGECVHWTSMWRYWNVERSLNAEGLDKRRGSR